MWKCKHCNLEFDFNKTSDKANHARWCKQNPERNNNENFTKAVNKRFDLKLGKNMVFVVSCFKCNKKFNVLEREKQFPKKEKYFCSLSCANSKSKSQEEKNKISNSVKKYYEINNIKELKFCKNCNIIINTKYVCCSLQCKDQLRLKKVLQYDDFKLYKYYSKFKFNLRDYPNEFDFKLIEKYGWYKAKNNGDNQNGISRDHIVSSKYAFENNIPTWIISHPANCKLMRHKDNMLKNIKSDLTLDELLEKITIWNKKYNAYSK